VSDAPENTNDAIRQAIRRAAHVFEFTAIGSTDAALLSQYLSNKLVNYVEIIQEQ
jgi:hypothetical protein